MLTPSQIEKTLQKAPLVFVGTITKRGATNLASLEANNDTALVKVERVITAPPAFKAIEGTTVTVKLHANSKSRTGNSKLFYTRKWMYAENLAVEAVIEDVVDKDHHQLIQEFRKAITNMERKER